jgi:hypothetical protein
VEGQFTDCWHCGAVRPTVERAVVVPRPEAALPVRTAGPQFAVVALLYIVGWLAARRSPGRRTGG